MSAVICYVWFRIVDNLCSWQIILLQTTAFDLNEENQRLKEKDTEMRLNLNRIKHANELDHAIEIQVTVHDVTQLLAH